jgi:hypothetical protein
MITLLSCRRIIGKAHPLIEIVSKLKLTKINAGVGFVDIQDVEDIDVRSSPG